MITNKEGILSPYFDKFKKIYTDDTDLATIFFCSGFKLIEIEVLANHKYIFSFKKEGDIENIMHDFYAGTLRINAFQLFRSMHSLAQLMAKHTES